MKEQKNMHNPIKTPEQLSPSLSKKPGFFLYSILVVLSVPDILLLQLILLLIVNYVKQKLNKT